MACAAMVPRSSVFWFGLSLPRGDATSLSARMASGRSYPEAASTKSPSMNPFSPSTFWRAALSLSPSLYPWRNEPVHP